MNNRINNNNKTKTSNSNSSIAGWTAFDLKQKGRLVIESDNEPYPLLSSSSSPAPTFPPKQTLSFKQQNKAAALLEKPFSSMLIPSSLNYHSLTTTIGGTNVNERLGDSSLVSTQNNVKNTGGIAFDESYKKLKFLHPWADESLVQDVLAGVNNDFDQALSLLEAMRVTENNDDDDDDDKKENVEFEDTSFGIGGVSLGGKESITSDPFNDVRSNVDTVDVEVAYSRLLSFLPVETEPEWEEDDVYLIHRKDAIRMIRSASSHSKAATDAYARGDHVSAHRFSLKAQEEWTAAEKLNADAAKAILALRNSENDPWTLDLHGLHAVEAVEALRERLQSIESLLSSNYLAPSIQKESGTLLSASAESTTHIKMGKSVRQHSLSGQRPKLLQVITGKGNHSRGAAALPSAIRNFLSENSYHFDETRPGVIMVRPKFRPK